MGSASDTGADRGRPATARAVSKAWLSTPWLLVLLAWAHAGELLFPPEKKWTVVISGLGLATAVLAWKQRGDRLSGRWLLCAWGASEGFQVFVCQGAYIWWPREGPNGDVRRIHRLAVALVGDLASADRRLLDSKGGPQWLT